MSTPAEDKEDQELARKVAYKVPSESARLIVELGQERLKALQIGGVALDGRTTQVAAFQLAAAAVAAGIATQQGLTPWPAFFAAIGCFLFVLGSALAFWGIRSCKSQVAGVDPSFWRDALKLPRFNDKIARSWAAEVTQSMIHHACRVDEVRASWLNRSLIAGGAGALLVLSAVSARVWDLHSKEFFLAKQPHGVVALPMKNANDTVSHR